ncbi:MAG: DUF6265 family protein [Sphingomicrobium sp.]
MIFSILAGLAATAAQLPTFMTGCWHLGDGQSWTEECWMEPKAGLMLGASREGRGDALKSWEWMAIERTPDGGVSFFAAPGGRSRTTFTLDRASVDEISFVNRAHDYPQRVTYRRVGDALEGEISLIDGKSATRWRYQRDSPATAP